MGLFNAISPLNGGKLSDYYNDRAYPIDLNGAQDYFRGPAVPSMFPFPLMIGAIAGGMNQVNAWTLAEMVAKKPFGPWMQAPQAPLQLAFPNIQGGLVKVSG